MLFVEKIFLVTSSIGQASPIDIDRRHVNTTENAMSSTDIFISNWFDVCWWSNISKTMLVWNGLLVLFVWLSGFPWNMARPQLHLLSLTVKKLLMSSLVFHIAIRKTSNISCTPGFDLLPNKFAKRVYYKTCLILENWRHWGINWYKSSCHKQVSDTQNVRNCHKQSGTKPNLVAKILATKIGNLSA